MRLTKGEEYDFVEMTDITPGHRYVSANQKRSYKGGGSRFQNGDILFARITPCLENGKIAQYQNKNKKKAFGSTEFVVLRNRERISIQDFVYYLALSDVVRKTAEKSMFGASGRQRVDLDVFRNIEIPSYTLDMQEKIASILNTFDNLIEINLRRIELLEEVAQSIYNEWFVHFRFPGHENTEIIQTESGPKPKGWTWKKIGDVVELAYGKGLRKSERIPGNFPVYGSSGIIGSHETCLVEGPTIVIGRKGNVGSIYWSHDNCYPIDTVYYTKTETSLYYIYYNFQHQNFIDSHAAVPGLSRGQAYKLPILVPSNKILEHFEKIVEPIFEQIYILEKRNEKLIQIRDTLLPKLVSGDIDVGKLGTNLLSD